MSASHSAASARAPLVPDRPEQGPPPRPSSGLRLVGRAVAARLAEGQPKRAAKLALRAVVFPRSTVDWLAWVETLRLELGLDQPPKDLVKKLHQYFVSRRFSKAQRAFLIKDHYRMLTPRLGSERVRALLAGEALRAAMVVGRSGRIYGLDLRRDPKFQMEGELVLSLAPLDRPDLRLAQLSVVLGETGPGRGRRMWIGGLQGSSVETARDAVVEATRDLSGLRPKQAVVEAAYALADAFALERIWAVPQDGHVLNFYGRYRRNIRADYDAFWTELGGVAEADGGFRLPRERSRRSEAEVPPKRRKTWRVRQALIAALQAAMGDALTPPDQA